MRPSWGYLTTEAGSRVISYGPLIDRTRQAWKLHAVNIGVLLAIAIHVIARWALPGISRRELALFSGASAVIAAVSLLIFFGTVRCPACGANWVWRATRERPGRWLQWLHEQQVCPVCGSSGNVPSDRRSRAE
jgi:predicted RNA-binding Zn-ribbon protein involved in translation (DUF1610 family)